MPAAIALGTSTFTMSALPGTPAIQNAIPMPFFGTTPFAAPGLGIIAAVIMLGFGIVVARARGSGRAARGRRIRRRRAGDGHGRRRLAVSRARDDRECVRPRGDPSRPREPDNVPGPLVAALPLLVVVTVNLVHVAR